MHIVMAPWGLLLILFMMFVAAMVMVAIVKMILIFPHGMGVMLLGFVGLCLLGAIFMFASVEGPMHAHQTAEEIVPPAEVDRAAHGQRAVAEFPPGLAPKEINIADGAESIQKPNSDARQTIPAVQSNDAALQAPAVAGATAKTADKKRPRGWLVEPNGRTTQVDKPDWCDQLADSYGANSTTTVVHAGPYDTPAACQQAISAEIQSAVIRYLEDPDFLGPGASRYVSQTGNYVTQKINRGVFTEVLDTSVGKMRMSYAKLEFTPEVRDRLTAFYEQGRDRQRAGWVVGAALGVLGLIAAAYAYLKIDTATRGYYTGRLNAAAAAAAVVTAVVVISLYFFRVANG